MSVVMVQHGGCPIKAKTIKMKLLQPIPDVGKKKLLDFPFTIVEKFRVPSFVVASRARMKILVFAAIKFI